MRALAALAICALLAGCSDADWDNAVSYLPIERGTRTADAPAPPPPQAVETGSLPSANPEAASQPAMSAAAQSEEQMPLSAMPPQSSMVASAVFQGADAHCKAVAAQRADDGGLMGMDEDQRKIEYDRTYADCAAWDARHGMAR